MIWNEFKGLRLCEIPQLNISSDQLEASLQCWVAASMWVLGLNVMMHFLSDIINNIIPCRWEEVFQRTDAAANTHRGLDTRCVVMSLATMYNDKQRSVFPYLPCHDQSGSNIAINNWGNTIGMWTTISFALHLAAKGSHTVHLWSGRPAIAVCLRLTQPGNF